MKNIEKLVKLSLGINLDVLSKLSRCSNSKTCAVADAIALQKKFKKMRKMRIIWTITLISSLVSFGLMFHQNNRFAVFGVVVASFVFTGSLLKLVKTGLDNRKVRLSAEYGNVVKFVQLIELLEWIYDKPIDRFDPFSDTTPMIKNLRGLARLIKIIESDIAEGLTWKKEQFEKDLALRREEFKKNLGILREIFSEIPRNAGDYFETSTS